MVFLSISESAQGHLPVHNLSLARWQGVIRRITLGQKYARDNCEVAVGLQYIGA